MDRLDAYGDAYIRALDRGDFIAVGAVLGEAIHDPELDQFLVEIDKELHREAGLSE